MNNKKKIEDFLEKQHMLVAFHKNYAEYGNHDDVLFDDWVDTIDERDILEEAFVWQCTVEGFNAWQRLNVKWEKYLICQ
jgi:hypothetical protein